MFWLVDTGIGNELKSGGSKVDYTIVLMMVVMLIASLLV